jgi:hypothetical protein
MLVEALFMQYLQMCLGSIDDIMAIAVAGNTIPNPHPPRKVIPKISA